MNLLQILTKYSDEQLQGLHGGGLQRPRQRDLQAGCPKGRHCEFCHHQHGPSVKLGQAQRVLLRSYT